MGKVKFESTQRVGDGQRGEGGYYLVQHKDGKLLCSCGNELIKNDDTSWKCSGGYPIYRPSDGEFFKDKFGDVYLKIKEHDKTDKALEGKEDYDGDEKRIKRLRERNADYS